MPYGLIDVQVCGRLVVVVLEGEGVTVKVNNVPRDTSPASVPRMKILTEVPAIPRNFDINRPLGLNSALVFLLKVTKSPYLQLYINNNYDTV